MDSVPLIANHFLKLFRKQLGRQIVTISDQALERMLRYSWPGNVRELRHVMERACVLCQDGVVQVKHLPAELQGPTRQEVQSLPPVPFQEVRSVATEDIPMTIPYQSEEEKIRQALRYVNNNKAKAAKMLGFARSTLYRKMERYNIPEE